MMWKELVYISILSAGIALIEIKYFPEATYLKNLTTVYSLLGFVISLLLVFRTNTAYDRWWEGRKVWGSMVNDSRNLSLKLNAIALQEAEKQQLAKLLTTYVFAVKNHLRNQTLTEDPDYTCDLVLAGKQPAVLEIQLELRALVEGFFQTGKIQAEQWAAIQRDLDSLVSSLGACERIKNTPIPFSYSLFIKKFIFIYVVTMPLAFVPLFGYFSAFISTFVFYALVSMELLAEEIEDPFGADTNDLPTDQICLNIESNVKGIFGC